MDRLPKSFVLLIACSLLPVITILEGAAAAQNNRGPAIPVNIRISPVFAAVFGEIVAASPTLARQCGLIGNATYVHVRVVPALSASTTSRGTARTTMRRFSAGALLAEVSIPVPLTSSEYAQLFGHEFEHVLEQIDHVDLESLALSGDGAFRLPDGAYESRRARLVGLTIANEYDRPHRAAVMTPLPAVSRRR